ncbi:methyltransferase [Nocardia amamiensis]|uniref:methyltransferase n=1 Tax=Nocardia amamiensis TaxID=404578 RepID=UPI00083720BF|nr:methyltransferase [Nocardia amamiensis]
MYRPKVIAPAHVTFLAQRLHAHLRGLLLRALPAPVAVLDMASGWLVTQALYTAARLSVADMLADGPLPADAIATRARTDPDATYRLLRTLAGYGVFAELAGRRFALTPLADPLRADSPRTVRPILLAFGHPAAWATQGELLGAVQTGRSGHELAHGATGFDYLEANPEIAADFHEAMRVTVAMAERPLLAAYDFTRFESVVDVGGGSGYLLAAILRVAPRARGTLYDLATATVRASEILSRAGVSDRCAIENGSFFDAVPTGADAYVLKNIVHDWADEPALRILRSVRDAIAPRGRLLLIECVVPDRRGRPHFSLWLDLEVLLRIGGRERTRDEYAQLLSQAGFRLRRVVPTASPLSLIEAVAV